MRKIDINYSIDEFGNVFKNGKQMKKKKLNGIKADVGRSAYVYFLEHRELEGMYIAEKPNEKGLHTLTRNPLEAMTFKEMGAAKIYLYLSAEKQIMWNDFYVTEHEFV